MFSGYLTSIPGTRSIQREIHELRHSIASLWKLKKNAPVSWEVERLILFKKTRLYYLRRVIDLTLAKKM